MLTVSKPPARSASTASGGARKVNSLFSGVPPVAMADSRLPTARSAADRIEVNGPIAVAGSRARRVAIGPSKFMSPANAIVIGCAGGMVVVVVDVVDVVEVVEVDAEDTAELPEPAPDDVSDDPDEHA